MISSAQELTRQFYEWEQRGRGWHKANYSVCLEPVFHPFFGHFLAQQVIDDGKQSTWLSAFSALFDPEIKQAEEPQCAYPMLAYPNDHSAPLSFYKIVLPRHFKQHIGHIEQLLIMLSYRKSPISFEIIASDTDIYLQWACNVDDADFISAQIEAFFPDCTILETDEDKVLAVFDTETAIYTVDFGLEEEFMRPIATLQADHDPYTPLFGILSRLDTNEYVIVQILFAGTHNSWEDSILAAVHDDSGKQSFFVNAPEMPQLAREKVAKPLFGIVVRAMTVADTLVDAALLLQQVSTTIVHASKGISNALIPLSDDDYTVEERLSDILLRESHRVGMLLNSKELATFVHFPAIHSPKLIGRSRTTKQVHENLTDHTYSLGINEHRGIEQIVSTPLSQRLRHIHVMGATGTGKSTLLKSLMMQDIAAGIGFMCLDPHGDLIEELVRHIPEKMIKDVVLIDPSDTDYPIAFNILVAHSDIEKELLASDLVAVFRRFSTSWGDQMNSVFANSILAFVYNTKRYHLGDLRRFLIEAQYRVHILATVTDADIVYYWQHEFPILKSGSIGSILTRLDSFLRPRVIRNMVCQEQSLDFAQLMDNNKIVLVKLSQGLLGAENSFLLGAFIVSKLQQTAMSRQVKGIEERIPFFCYIDEFQHFVTPSMASILSGARKYGLGLILSHQDMHQVSKYDIEIASSVLANAGTRICFRLGDTDAKRLAEGFSAFSAEDLQNLSTGEAIARVNTSDNDFNLAVISSDEDTDIDYTDEIKAYSRMHYCVSIPTSVSIESAVEVIKEHAPLIVTKEPAKTVMKDDFQRALKQENVREHKYLQNFVKIMAEAKGYKSNTEVSTPDGTGQVDVVLEKDGHAIAVEISVTTSPEWELHNIQKCLAAGYSRIVVCTTQSAKLQQIKAHIAAQLTKTEQEKIQVIASNELHLLFENEISKQPTETVIKGYRVKVNYEPNASRQNLLQSIVKASRKE